MKMNGGEKITKSYYLIITAFLIFLMLVVPANAGVSPEEGRSIGDMGNRTAVIGETNLSFVDVNKVPIPEGIIKSNWENSNINIPFEGTFDSSDYKDELVSGEYNVVGVYNETIIYFRSPKLDVKTEIGGEEVTKVTKGDDINFTAVTELNFIKGPRPNYINYKLVDPSGAEVTNVSGTSLININVNETGKDIRTINTTNLKTGTYTLSIETDPATNNGLDAESPSVSFTIEIRGVTIVADIAKQTVNEDITFTVSTSPNTWINLNVTTGIDSNVQFRRDIAGVYVAGDGHSASGRSDIKDGNFTAVAYLTDTGSYEITATELIADTKASITVQIVDFSASVSTDKSVYYIGEPVEITGSANAGDSITIKVDDTEIKSDIGAPTEKFTYTWTATEDASPVYYKIGMWVLPHSDPGKDVPDASTSILFIRGGLSAKVIKTGIEGDIIDKIVAQGDDFEIKGMAPGRDNVDILTIAPKGGSGTGFDPTDIFSETGGVSDVPGLTHATSSVSHGKADFGEFTKRIDVDKSVNTGTYLIAVLNPGRDGLYGTSGSGEIVGIICSYDLLIKTQKQILAILKEETINKAGSDDLLWIGTIKVENPCVTLDDIEDVYLGSDIIVTGVSNRKEGFPIIISAEGPTDLTPQIASIEGGTFTISFSTASAKVGKYAVTVDDGDGHIDTKTVNILPGTAPSFNISGSPVPAAMQEGTTESINATHVATPTLTPTSTKAETKKKPGFELIFTIAGILAAVGVVAWLVLRQRGKQGEGKGGGDSD